MFWNDFDGSELFNRVFTYPVIIDKVDVFDLKIDRQGPKVILNFDLVGHIPDNPPVKWGKRFNRCRCGINCTGVENLSIEGVSVDMLGKINVTRDNEVEVLGEGFRIFFKFSHIQLTGPSVYESQS